MVLEDLSSNEKVYVLLSAKITAWLSRKAKRLGKYSQLSKEFARMRAGQKVSLNFALKLTKCLGVSSDALQDNIELISSCKSTDVGIKNPKIPFDFSNTTGARFIAAIQGDGYFNKFLQCGYSNQDKKMIEKVLCSAKEIFGGLDYKIYFREDNTFHLNFPKVVGLILGKTGLKPGYKYISNPAIPDFILNSEEGIKTSYLRQFFSDEGNVRKKDRRIQVKQTVLCNVDKETAKRGPEKFSPNVLLGCKILLQDIGIDSKISLGAYRKTPKGNKTDWELSFYRIENLKKFQELVGFEQEYKNNALAGAIESYKFPSAARNGKIDFALKNCKIVQSGFGFIDKKKLATQSSRSLKTATYYLVELKKKGLVEIIEKPKRKDGRYLLFKYKLMDRQ